MLLVLGTLAVVAWSFRNLTRDWYTSKNEAVFFSALAGAMVFGVLVLVAFGLTEWTQSKTYEVTGRTDAPIVTLHDGEGSSSRLGGSFFLGIGSVVGEGSSYLAYTWYQREPDGRLRGMMVQEDGYNDVFVHETDSGRPRVTSKEAQNQCLTPWWLAPIHRLCERDELQTEWNIYVPKGTVLRGYSLGGR